LPQPINASFMAVNNGSVCEGASAKMNSPLGAACELFPPGL
jgi:hypothetical protein